MTINPRTYDLQCPHDHGIKIQALGNSCTFGVVTAFYGHVIALYNLPSWLLRKKVNGEASRENCGHVMSCLMTKVIHLVTVAERF